MKTHRVFNLVLILALLLALLPAGETPALAQAPETEITRDTLYVPGEIVLGFERDLTEAQLDARAQALAGSVGAMVVSQYANMALLSTDPAADVTALAGQLAVQAGVAFAEPNYISWIPEADPLGEMVELSEVTRRTEDGKSVTLSVEDLKSMRTVSSGKVTATYPNDEYNNWGNQAIGHDIIWPNKNPSPVVCVIDTGADDRHPDLKGNILKGYDFVNNDKTPNDDNGHGTHVSGTIAAKTGNGIGPAGISNGKVLAVKALNAQGWGTDYDISKAIRYCADNKSVGVINMSLGGRVGTSAEYQALDYAINEKGKLVVAAAGNGSTTDYSYPAGWAKDPDLGNGLLSVGASRYPDYNYHLWVDTNGNNIEETSEYYNGWDCATSFSNYGHWVEIVAPGESIYSTTPVSYPFWMNYWLGFSSGYDSFDGTSMATPHVAGAAARAWSFYRGETNTQIHDRLLDEDHSHDLNHAVDPHVPNETAGYNQLIPSGPGAGDFYGFIDEDTVRAPFCWPSGSGYYMDYARFLNVAAAMERGTVLTEVTDATTGLPLTGATITIKHAYTGKTLQTAKMTSIYTSYAELINIPADYNWHPLYVSMSGYTAGSQIFGWGITLPGLYVYTDTTQVGVPPKTGTTVVANWEYGYDLDLFSFLPAGSPSGVVGSGYSGHPRDMGVGTLMDYPYARWHRDGGGGDPRSVEAITLVNARGALYPYYLGASPYGEYEIYLRDYNGGYDLNDARPVIRIWNNGKIYFIAGKDDICSVGEEWYKVGTIVKEGRYPYYEFVDTCGTTSLWPYAEGNAISTISQDK